MGHEYAGTVAALGRRRRVSIGDRVAVEVHKGCDRCENCIRAGTRLASTTATSPKAPRKGLTVHGGIRRVRR